MGNRGEKILVLGVGNDLLRDEGVGVHVIKAMEGMPLPANVSLVNGGVAGIDLLDDIMAADRLVIIDAVNTGDRPGRVYRFCAGEVELIIDNHKTSLHQVDIVDTLKLARFLGYCPDTVIIGVQPKDVSWGLELTPELASRIPLIIDLVMREVQGLATQTQL